MSGRPVPQALIQTLGARTRRVDGPGLDALRDHLLERHGESIEAILFYGSCLRSGDPFEGLVDLYVIPRDYRTFYSGRLAALVNWLLPPNVYYLELDTGGRTVRAKYAVVSLKDFQAGTTRWFHSYLWGRFTQPVAFLYTRDEAARQALLSALAQATLTFLGEVLPESGQDHDVEALWTTGLGLSYRAELRAERPDRVLELFRTHEDHYRALTEAARPYLSHRGPRKAGLSPWTLRIPQGKVLSVLRLLKALFTFHGGMDYILWKIERHSGVSVAVSPFARRHPLLGGWGVFWRLYRRGAFR